MDFNKSCLHCKSFLAKDTGEKNGINFSKFKQPQIFNDKKCEYLCSLDGVLCEKRDWYCHRFEPDFKVDNHDKNVQV